MNTKKTANPGEIELVFIRKDGCYGKTIEFIEGESVDSVVAKVRAAFKQDTEETNEMR